MPVVPDISTITSLSAVTAVSVYVFLEVIKTAFSDWKKANNGDTPWWYYASIRLVAVVLGGFFGTILYEEVGGLGSGYPWGTLIGCGAGGMCTFLVMVMKKWLKAKAENP